MTPAESFVRLAVLELDDVFTPFDNVIRRGEIVSLSLTIGLFE